MATSRPVARQRRRVLEVGEPFFARHGAKAVFFGRWITGLRTWASWLAGGSNMSWRSFVVRNATGAVSWAVTIGLLGYFIGQSAGGAITTFGLITVGTILLSALGLLLVHHLRGRRAAAMSPRWIGPGRRILDPANHAKIGSARSPARIACPSRAERATESLDPTRTGCRSVGSPSARG